MSSEESRRPNSRADRLDRPGERPWFSETGGEPPARLVNAVQRGCWCLKWPPPAPILGSSEILLGFRGHEGRGAVRLNGIPVGDVPRAHATVHGPVPQLRRQLAFHVARAQARGRFRPLLLSPFCETRGEDKKLAYTCGSTLAQTCEPRSSRAGAV